MLFGFSVVTRAGYTSFRGAQTATPAATSPSSSGTHGILPSLSSLHLSSSTRISLSPAALTLLVLVLSSSTAAAALSSHSDLAVSQPPSLSFLAAPDKLFSAPSSSSSSSSSSLLGPKLTLVDNVSLGPNKLDKELQRDHPQQQQQQQQLDHDIPLYKRQGPGNNNPTPTKPTNTPKPTKSNNAKPSMSSTPTSSGPTTSASIPIVTNPPQGGDNALFGVPSKVGSFNLTSGLLIYLAFLIAFCSTIGYATLQRRRYRNQFREQMRAHNAESGRQAGGDKGAGGSGDQSDAALFKQASLSRRALMKDVGPSGAEAATLAAAMAGGSGTRSYEERDGRVRFGESDPSTLTGRAGGMKKNNHYYNNNNNQYGMPLDQEIELEAYRGQHHQGRRDPSLDDNNDYSRPPLQESENYYSSSSSSSAGGGYMDQAEGGNGTNVQYPRPAYQQSSAYQQQHQPSRSPSPPIFVQRTNSTRMPRADLYDGNNIYRNDSQQRTTAGRAGSGSRRAGAGPTSPMGRNTPDMYDMGRQGSSGSGRGGPTARSGSRGAPSPTPVVRSNSTRLPPQMRVATPQPSSLSNQTTGFDML